MTEAKTNVEKLIQKATEADNADTAMKYAQAALNAANAICSIKTAEATK